ncbi:hypothetical protein Nepgr_016334 [Nepenthes gracilis]|uniref:H(+)-exporting diphosphatase n=1 Tax=Nepenthes gracilis TaxID=150966 RepID=A0AAD3SMI6_NEPGR|nr:hypothetical protein Nepgr_016334 [Nepenthes gracilis]
MGFLLTENGLLVLYIVRNLFKLYYDSDWGGLFESITGHGLDGSSMALFDRVALHLLSTIATINAHSSISESAGDIDKKAGMSHRIHERTETSDVAGNTSSMMGKGIANCLAALVSLAFWGVFVSRASNPLVIVLIRDIQISYFYNIWVLSIDNKEGEKCSSRDEWRSP